MSTYQSIALFFAAWFACAALAGVGFALLSRSAPQEDPETERLNCERKVQP